MKILKNILKALLRPLVRPLLERIRLLFREELASLLRAGSAMPIAPILAPVQKKLPNHAWKNIILPLHIVDIGAKLLNRHIYESLVLNYQTNVVGFDPTVEKTEKSLPHGGKEQVLPYFIGDGQETDFHIAHYAPTSSSFPPDRRIMERFAGLYQGCATVETLRLQSYRLDEIPEAVPCDLLKIDTQGSELNILKNGKSVLESCLCIFVEVEFQAIYMRQPLFADIDIFLRSSGFDFMRFSRDHGHIRYAVPEAIPADSAFLWSDAIYFKKLEVMEKNPANLLKAALFANDLFQMYDWSFFLLHRYDELCGTHFAQEYEQCF